MNRIYLTVVLNDFNFSDVNLDSGAFYNSYNEAKSSYVGVIEKVLSRLDEDDEWVKAKKRDVEAIKANRDVVPLHFQFNEGGIFQLWFCDVPLNEKGDG